MITKMQQLSLAQLFGVGAFQDANVLTITKTSRLGLTPSANNTAESLLAASLLTALQNFQGSINDENNQPIMDESGQGITFDNSEVFQELGLINWDAFFTRKGTTLHQTNQGIALLYAPN